MKRTLVVLACAMLVGCSAHRAPMGILVLRVAPLDARVTLDDRFIGSARQLSGHPLRLGVGLRRLEISAEKHYAVRREAQIKPAGRVEIDVQLHEVPDGEPLE